MPWTRRTNDTVAVNGTPGSEITLAKVFTPSTPAERSYVPRPQQEKDLRRALSTPGTQTVVYGESGAGKTSLTLRILTQMGRPYVVTRCDTGTDYRAVLTSAFHQMGTLKRTSQRDSDTRSLHGAGGVPGFVEAGGEWELAQEKEFSPLVDAPLSAEHLAQQMGRQGKVWVIEDFHKTSAETKTALAHALKIFSDVGPEFPNTQVVVLGAADTPVEVWGTPDANLRDRLAYIGLPPLNDDELGAVIDKGAELLNVDFATVRQEIIRHSVGLAGVTHGLAYECCYVSDVQIPQATAVTITSGTLAEAKANYSRTRQVEIKHAFEKALLVKRTRTYNNHSIIVKALATLGEKGGTHAEIYAAIKQEHPNYPSSNLTLYLRELQQEDRGAVIRKTATGQFRFEKPMMHTYARQLFRINSLDAFWSDIEASESEKDAAAESLVLGDEEADTEDDRPADDVSERGV
jgi:hypothetical protein